MNNKENTLSEKLNNSKFITKLKSIKHFDIIIVIIFVCILLFIYFGDNSTFNTNSDINQTTTSYEEYTNELETRLCTVLSKISGAGKVNVMITLATNSELVIAYKVEEKNNTDGSVTIKKEPVIITKNGTSNPLVLSETLPAIQGVVIVAQGANDITVKLNLLSATVKLLNISANTIEIFAGN